MIINNENNNSHNSNNNNNNKIMDRFKNLRLLKKISTAILHFCHSKISITHFTSSNQDKLNLPIFIFPSNCAFNTLLVITTVSFLGKCPNHVWSTTDLMTSTTAREYSF